MRKVMVVGVLVLSGSCVPDSGESSPAQSSGGAVASSSVEGFSSSGQDPSSSSQGGVPPSSGVPSSTSGGQPSSAEAPSSSVSTTSSGGLADPALDGPEPVSHLVDTVSVTATGTNVGVDAYYPASGSGPFPVVLLNHGFQLPTSQYRTYAQRLASHGMVAVLVDYQAGMFSVNHVKNTREILGVLDWALGRAELHADPNAVGVTGHSLGGKLSFQAAVMDSRIKAVLGLDPVDGAQNCSAENCPDVTDMLPGLQAATGVLGETTDSSGGMQPCAPAANNYATFYDQLPSPTFKVTVNGANHMSFLDDLASCGLTCMFCQQATATNSEVNGLARAYVTAFFRRHLRGEPGYDAYLTGDQARARYVDGGLAAIETK